MTNILLRFASHGSGGALMLVVLLGLLLPGTTLSAAGAADSATNDPYLWLEDVAGEKALAWVRQQNALSTRELEAAPGFDAVQQKLLSILNSNERIPFVAKHGKFYYNFWRDAKNPRGLFRRTTLEEYKKPNPAWETVLDLDQLAAAEKENWVWRGYDVLQPDYDRCLISLSRGGADAAADREFDLNRKEFVADGFKLPEAKSDVTWRNRDAVYVGTDFGPGSMTQSGYPRVIKEWQRGTPLTAARVVFEGKVEDVSAGASVVHDHGHVYEFLRREPTFFTDEVSVRRGDNWVRIEKPADALLSTFGENLLLRLHWAGRWAAKRMPPVRSSRKTSTRISRAAAGSRFCSCRRRASRSRRSATRRIISS